MSTITTTAQASTTTTDRRQSRARRPCWASGACCSGRRPIRRRRGRGLIDNCVRPPRPIRGRGTLISSTNVRCVTARPTVTRGNASVHRSVVRSRPLRTRRPLRQHYNSNNIKIATERPSSGSDSLKSQVIMINYDKNNNNTVGSVIHSFSPDRGRGPCVIFFATVVVFASDTFSTAQRNV